MLDNNLVTLLNFFSAPVVTAFYTHSVRVSKNYQVYRDLFRTVSSKFCPITIITKYSTFKKK